MTTAEVLNIHCHWWAFASASRLLFEIKSLENPACVLITNKKIAGPFSQYTNQLRQADGKTMELSETLCFPSGVFKCWWCPSPAFVSLHFPNLLWNMQSLSVPESAWTFSQESMILADRSCSHFNSYRLPLSGGVITWPLTLLTDFHH